MNPGPSGGGWHVAPFGGGRRGLLPDPHFEWLLATGFAYYGPRVTWLPVLVQLSRPDAQQFAQQVQRLQGLAPRKREWATDVQVPPFFATPPKRLRRATRFVSMLMTRTLLERVYAGKEPKLASMIRRIAISRPGTPGQPVATPLSGPFSPPSGEGPPQLVIAIIDDAIPFAHDRLRSSNGSTRVEYLLEQANSLGREISKTAALTGLDALTLQATHNGKVDEDQVYRLARLIDPARPGHQPLAARFAHGAHVAYLACSDLPPPPPRQRPIIGVQLPADVVADTSGAGLEMPVFYGLYYALSRTETIEQSFGTGSLPLLANVSYGVIAGPHDGSGLLEAAVDNLLNACNPSAARFHVLLPSGNSHLSRCHARFDLPATNVRTLPWRVSPDDPTPGSMQIRLPKHAAGVTITLTLPDGSLSSVISPGSVVTMGPPSAVQVLVTYPLTSPPARVVVTIFIAPTAATAGGVPLVPAGLWRVTLNNHSTKPVNGVHAWIQRDETSPGFPQGGRQSYFDDPTYVRFDAGGRAEDEDPLPPSSLVVRQGLLNAFATGKRPLVVGAFRRSDGAPAPYSAGGPLPPPGRGWPNPHGPEAMLPGDDSPSHPGVLGAGTRSGSWVAMSGTSAATPQALRALARAIAAGGAAGRHALFAMASASPPWPTPAPGADRGGGGRLDEPSTRPPR